MFRDLRALYCGGSLSQHEWIGAELTRNIYALLLVIECGLVFFSEPFFERWRRGRTLPSGLNRGVCALWMAGVAVVLAGH